MGGSLLHDLLKQQEIILPGDALKAVVMWLRASQLLPKTYSQQARTYRDAAEKALDWLHQRAMPMGDVGFSKLQRGLPEDAEAGFFGHFREFDSMEISENSWSHSIVGGEFGSDAGGTYPNYVLCLLRLLMSFPEDEQAPAWKEYLRRFIDGYLLPACRENPFGLVPQGISEDEGALWFTETFHGTNLKIRGFQRCP